LAIGFLPESFFVKVKVLRGGFTLWLGDNIDILFMVKQAHPLLSNKAFPRADSFSPSCNLFSVGRMAQIGVWSRLRNQDSYSSMLEKNSPDSSWLMFYFLRENALPDLTDVS
jgi:hypothetical protein